MAYSNYSGRFGGEPIVHPKIGDYVTVRSGRLFEGERLKVVDVCGHVYAIGYRVYLDTPDGEDVWYWPWDLIIEGA